MPRSGEVWGAGFGDTKSKTLDSFLDLVAGSVARYRFMFSGKFRGKSLALFNNGQFSQAGFTPYTPDGQTWLLPTPSTAVDAAVEGVEIGVWGVLDETLVGPDWIGGWVEEEEADSAKRLRINWTAQYVAGTPSTDPISSISLTGVSRFVNCDEVDGFPSRALIRYTLVNINGAERVLRLFGGQQLIAEGNRTNDGAITLSERNSSGVTGTAIVVYIADKLDGEITIRWPAQWRIHYDYSPLSFPRTEQDTVYDGATNAFEYLTPVLNDGNVYYTVQAVSDDGTADATPVTPSDSPKLIYDKPYAPTDIYFSGNYAAPVVHWTLSETPNCRYRVYSSLVDEPVNLYLWNNPVPIETGENATSATIPPITNWTPLDFTSDWDTMISALETWHTNINATMDSAVRSTYETLVTAAMVEFQDAVNTLGETLNIPVDWVLDMVNTKHDQLIRMNNYFADLIDADWEYTMWSFHAELLDFASMIIDGERGRYLMPNGQLPFAGTATDTGSTSTSENAGSFTAASDTLLKVASPLIRNRKVRVIVRAVSSGVMETGDNVYAFELDSVGDIVPPRPNDPGIESVATSGLMVSPTVLWTPEDSPSEADYIDLYVVVLEGTPNPASPSDSEALSLDINDAYRATPSYTVGATGYYDVYVAARVSSTGARSSLIGPYTVWLDNTDPLDATSISAKVIRS